MINKLKNESVPIFLSTAYVSFTIKLISKTEILIAYSWTMY